MSRNYEAIGSAVRSGGVCVCGGGGETQRGAGVGVQPLQHVRPAGLPPAQGVGCERGWHRRAAASRYPRAISAGHYLAPVNNDAREAGPRN